MKAMNERPILKAPDIEGLRPCNFRFEGLERSGAEPGWMRSKEMMMAKDTKMIGDDDLKPQPPQSSGAITVDPETPDSDDPTDTLIIRDRTLADKVRDSDIAGKLRDGSEKLASQAGDKARGLVSQGLERASETLANVSKMVSDTAGGIDERLGEDYGDYARMAAEAIDRASTSLGSKSPDELIDDTREFVRKSPGIALAGAAVVGFVLARLIKSGLSPDTDDGDRKGRA
jgi:ElaB/YqjD/DUF883 family membrane-anchored ribosome-binding protein